MSLDVRPMSHDDLGEVVAVHRAAFTKHLMTFFGPRFLRLFYAFVIDSPRGVTYVATIDGNVAGFVAGVLKPTRFYRRFLFWRAPLVALALIPPIVRRPETIVRIARRVVQRTSGNGVHLPGAELMSLAVVPGQQHHGIGAALVRQFVNRVHERGVPALWLATDDADNDEVKTFYEHLGFEKRRAFTNAEGRALAEYARSSEPIE